MSYINESIIYNIYPLGFCGAPRENDGKLEYRLDKIYGWIDHLKSMSVNCVVFNPLFESSRHGYDTIDYRRLDCRLGDNESFKKICSTLHKNGIKIILDGVFNHVGRDFFAFKDVQQKKWDSPYCSWFQNLNFDGRSPFGDPFWYEGWAGHYDLVKLNLSNNDVVNYLLDSVKFWIEEFDIDGLRLDAADCIDLGFFKKLRALCKGMKPDFWLYGEITHGDYNRWANGETLDSVTNYECYKGLYSCHNDRNYFEIAHSLNRQFGNGGIYGNIYTYNFVDNHDVNRVASSLKNKNHLNNVYSLMYTMPGVPSIYYGSEFGIEGVRSKHSDYELRPCLDLDEVYSNNPDLLEHIKKLGRVRLSLEALKYGGFENVNIMNEKLVYKRQSDNQTVFVAFNLTDRDETIGFDTRTNAMLTDVLNDNEIFDVNGYFELPMKPYSSRILVVNDGTFKVDFTDKNDEISDNQIGQTEEAESKQESEDNSEEELTNDTEEEVKLGVYSHYSGKKYSVVGFAKLIPSDKPLVLYRAIDDNGMEMLASPYDFFNDEIEFNGQKVKRFTYLE